MARHRPPKDIIAVGIMARQIPWAMGSVKKTPVVISRIDAIAIGRAAERIKKIIIQPPMFKIFWTADVRDLLMASSILT